MYQVLLFSHRSWLPRHFDEVKLINAWRVGRKLGRQLISYNLGTADGLTAENQDTPNDVSHTAGDTGTSTTVPGTLLDTAAAGSSAELHEPTPRHDSPSHSDEFCENETT